MRPTISPQDFSFVPEFFGIRLSQAHFEIDAHAAEFAVVVFNSTAWGAPFFLGFIVGILELKYLGLYFCKCFVVRAKSIV